MRISDWSSDVCSSDLAMSESKIRELTIGARQAGDKVIIEISDTGTGIPAADRPKLFDAFFSTKKSGLGIGLLVSRTSVEAHGGHIRAEGAERVRQSVVEGKRVSVGVDLRGGR